MGGSAVTFEIEPPSKGATQFEIEPPAVTTPSAAKRLVSSFGSGAGVVSNEQGKNFFLHPIDTAKGMLEAQGELGQQAAGEFKSGDYLHAAQHGIEYLLPGVGPSLAHAGEQLESGDIAGGVGTTLGTAAITAADPERITNTAKSGLSKVGELRSRFQPIARQITGVEPAVKDAVTNAAEKHGEALTKNRAVREETVRGNLQNQREAQYDIAKGKIATAEENKGIEAKNQAVREGTEKRTQLTKTVDEQSNQLRERLAKVEDSVGKEANSKFEAVRSKVGNPEADPEGLIATVKNVEQNVLQGIPENIKEFHHILGLEGMDPAMADWWKGVLEDVGEGGQETPAKPITWDKLQSLKSRMDARLRTARTSNMNGDLKRAIYDVRDGVVDEMGKMAEANGAGPEWQDARNFWRNYKQDFHEPTGPSGSGSPVAQALDAVDPRNIRQPFIQKQATTGNRALEILRKYPTHGGAEAASLAEQLLGNVEAGKAIPSAKELPLKQNPQSYELPTSKVAPKAPVAPTVDIQQVAKDAIAIRAKNWGSFNARDIGILSSGVVGEFLGSIFGSGTWDRLLGAATGVGAYEGGKYAASRMLNKPAVVEWLSKTPASEIEVLNKIPGADRVKIINTLTEAAVTSGRPVRISPAAQRFLGAANVARIMAATGNRDSKVKTPADAKQLLAQ